MQGKNNRNYFPGDLCKDVYLLVSGELLKEMQCPHVARSCIARQVHFYCPFLWFVLLLG